MSSVPATDPFEIESNGRVALVTGASSGIGEHLALLLARRGYRLALAARRVANLSTTADCCRAAGATEVETFSMDVMSAAGIEGTMETIASRFGRVDLLVNNAGIAGGAMALDTSVEQFDAIMATNVRGAWLVATAVARLMRNSGGGDIVNIASILGLRVANAVAPYAMSKAAVIQMTRALALEWARHEIRINALAPGYIETELNSSFFATEAGQAMVRRIPQRRLGQLSDLDAPFLLLATGASRYLTGAVLTVDGGHHISSL